MYLIWALLEKWAWDEEGLLGPNLVVASYVEAVDEKGPM
jgi:hypothetical protein